jgi:hypothetical protein
VCRFPYSRATTESAMSPADLARSRWFESYLVARALWRRGFALSLALRLLARIVLLDLAIFFTWGSDLKRSAGGGLRLSSQARYRQLAIVLKVVLRLVPTTENAAMAATAIRAAIKAYSIAVTPLVSPISRSIARPSPLSSTWFSNVVSFIFW